MEPETIENFAEKPQEPIQLSNRERIRTMVKKTLSLNYCQPALSNQTPSSPTKTQLSNIHDPRSFENYFMMLSKIGEGCSGVVKKCKQIKSGDIYAVKISRTNDEQIIRIIKRTYQLMHRIHHENVIRPKCLFINQNAAKSMLVMEYCDYPSLKKLLETHDFSEDQSKKIIRQLLLGVSAIHNYGVCHRDIKPDNILYDISNHKLKIIDFGISKFIYNYKTVTKQKMWTVTGLIYYKAPEMFSGVEYDQSIDSWAIGITAYELLYKKLPFYSEQQSETIQKIESTQPNYEGLKYKHPFLAIDFIKSLLKKNPAHRSSVDQALCHPWIQNSQQSTKSQFKLRQDYHLNRLMNLNQSSMSLVPNIENQSSKRFNNFSPQSDIFQITRQLKVFGAIRSLSQDPDESKSDKKHQKKSEKKFNLQFQLHSAYEANEKLSDQI